MDAKPTLLLVEDDASVRRLALRMLEIEGYRVLDAASGRAALAHAESAALDLVLTDYKLPDLSGEDLLARLRERQPALPAVVMSGYGQDVMDTPAGPARTLFLSKPFSRDSLREKVKAALAP